MSKSCFYCDVYPRNPCYDSDEASRCPNCRNKEAYLDFNSKDVASWIRYSAKSFHNPEKGFLIIAAQLIERYL